MAVSTKKPHYNIRWCFVHRQNLHTLLKVAEHSFGENCEVSPVDVNLGEDGTAAIRRAAYVSTNMSFCSTNETRGQQL